MKFQIVWSNFTISEITDAGETKTTVLTKIDDVLYPSGYGMEVTNNSDLLVKLYPRRPNQRDACLEFRLYPSSKLICDTHMMIFYKDKVAHLI